MSLYVSLVKFTPEGLATMKEKGVDRSEMVKRNVESSGGESCFTRIIALVNMTLWRYWTFLITVQPYNPRFSMPQWAISESRLCQPFLGMNGGKSFKRWGKRLSNRYRDQWKVR